MEDECPKTKKCPLFNGNLLKRHQSAEVYKNLYCRAGVSKYGACKRYIVSEQLGKCADFVLPNSSFTVEEITERMIREGLI